MAKALNLVLGGNTFALAPTKVERKKLYGWTELRATDPDGVVCRQAGLDSNGVTIIPKGATASSPTFVHFQRARPSLSMACPRANSSCDVSSPRALMPS